jgi:6-phosphofructo-2-kinase
MSVENPQVLQDIPEILQSLTQLSSLPMRQNSGSTTPRTRPPATTLNIPGMTRSRASPDGRIAQRDVASKLVIIMVGLPARGKSYITKKIQRYLSWQQHNTKIFNVGTRRRVAAGVTPGTINGLSKSPRSQNARLGMRTGSIGGKFDAPTQAAHILLNGKTPLVPEAVDEDTGGQEGEEEQNELEKVDSQNLREPELMDQSAGFFDPSNTKASQIREQVALSTLDELLDYLLVQGGAVGILDATNSTIERRKTLFKHIKDREPKLGILFIESVCEDQDVSSIQPPKIMRHPF